MLIAVLSDICHCEAAGSAKEALHLLSVASIDLIVLDIQMPDMSGLDFCEHIRANHNFVNIPVIFITGSVERNIQEACWLAGGNDFVKKPVISNTLKQRVENCLKSKVVAESVFNTGYDDPLTGLNTEYYLRNEVAEVLRYCQLHHQAFTLLMVKISGIDAINRHQGFMRGNQAIQAVARVIEGQLNSPLRKCCRIRGATFAVSLPDLDRGAALLFTEQISQAMGKYLYSQGTMLPLNIKFKSSMASCGGEEQTDILTLLEQCQTTLAATPEGEYLIKPSVNR